MTSDDKPPVPAVDAATILLVRDEPAFQVLMVKRHHQIDFAGGALVFPGGKADPQDRDPAWSARCFGWDEVPAMERALRVCALREAFEESGVLAARTAENGVWRVDPRAADSREAVSRGTIPFLELVTSLGLKLDLGALALFARWITPAMMPKRFDTYFFVATAPADQLAACDGWETVDAEWIEPEEALRLGELGERKVMFPTRMNLQLLAESRGADVAIAAARARPSVAVLPVVQATEAGEVLAIPANAGYGAVVEPLSAVMA